MRIVKYIWITETERLLKAQHTATNPMSKATAHKLMNDWYDSHHVLLSKVPETYEIKDKVLGERALHDIHGLILFPVSIVFAIIYDSILDQSVLHVRVNV